VGESKESRGSTVTLYGYPATAYAYGCYVGASSSRVAFRATVVSAWKPVAQPCWRRGVASDVRQGVLCPVGLGLALWWLWLALLLLVLSWLLALAGLGRGTVGYCPCSGFWGGTRDFHLSAGRGGLNDDLHIFVMVE
jgi:hypothetical protein